MKRIGSGLLLALMALALIVTPVYADMPSPDDTPTADINIYRNLNETGDLLLISYYNIPYLVPPDDPITSTFAWSFRDGATIFGSTSGFAYNDNGYGYGVASVYMSAANVTASGLVWGNPYTLRLSGSPAFFATPPIYNFSVTAGDYSAAVAQADAQTELADRIIVIAELLNNRWGLLSMTLLTQEGETRTVLTSSGEAYFRGTIFGVQNMAPTIFASVITPLDYTDRTWSDNYTAQIENQYAGTWVETSKAAGAALFGTSYDLLSVIMMLFFIIAIIVFNIILGKNTWAGLMDACFLCVVGAKLDLVPFLFILLIAAMCWFYISTRIWERLIPR